MYTTKELKRDLRNGPYAWPGGYPTFFIMVDGEALCHKCARGNFRGLVSAILEQDMHNHWRIMAHDINWEDSHLYCANCNTRIESAYAEDDNGTEEE